MVTTGLGIAISFTLGILRIIFNVSIKKVFIVSYLLIFILALFTTPEFFAFSFDASGVTTGEMTVPFILSLGAGITNVLGREKASHETFGLIGVASVGPIILMLLLGVIL